MVHFAPNQFRVVCFALLLTPATLECSNKVLSEFCVPILDSAGEVVGIIDAESWSKNFFVPEQQYTIAQVAFQLGQQPIFV
jgi:putative methionine-R-sulfoxide reductase with GAF domain